MFEVLLLIGFLTAALSPLLPPPERPGPRRKIRSAHREKVGRRQRRMWPTGRCRLPELRNRTHRHVQGAAAAGVITLRKQRGAG